MTTFFIVFAIFIGLSALFSILRTIFNLNVVSLFFLPDIIAGFIWLLTIILHIFGLFFSRSGMAFVFFCLIVFGIIAQAMGIRI